jgi:hypothetical protein
VGIGIASVDVGKAYENQTIARRQIARSAWGFIMLASPRDIPNVRYILCSVYKPFFGVSNIWALYTL